ncbi:MAG TPA: hypothetical protein PKA33_08535 [Amaricoccus sp.]|uniref:hypothetical protein n=1 Tax=Amaricoccus sp. TaxID=1872485 RepID=UPI002BD1D68C|nr:hypothetical protein [Amaricoccus sp.]HMQ94602.1 hypothetical protein [Amaricoccus sp.]HMR52446.1 hypothetical protein [Amaricoccus sp.]HMR61401.1 hypothetical protein [Amaricoccus sp.]HMT99398.1 hypothetical protein [Amaricoccus sp.]
MTKTAKMNRREILAGAAAAATIPLAGQSAPHDPVHEAIALWKAANGDITSVLGLELSDREMQPFEDREYQARLAVCETRATSLSGLSAQLLFAFGIFGEGRPGFDLDDPDGYEFGEWTEHLDEKLLRNLLATSRELAAR